MGLFSLLIIASAFISFISFAPFKFEWLIFIALVPIFFNLDRIKTSNLSRVSKLKQISFIGFIYGITYMSLTNLWTFELIEFSSILEITILFIVYTLLQTVFYCFIFFFFGYFNSSLGIFACYWVIFEYLKCLGPFGSPNGILGYSLSNNYMSEFASYLGVYFLSFIIIMVNFLLYKIIRNGFARKNINIQFGFVICLIIILLLPKVVTLSPVDSNKSINVGLIQVNHPISYKLIAKNRRAIRNDYISLSKHALTFSELDLIIWPETITASENLKFPLFMSQVNTLSTNNNTGFLFGTPRKHLNKYYNSAALVLNNSIRFYDKNYLMPFGEYWPAKKAFKLFKLDNIIPGSEFSRGNNQSTFTLKSIKIGVGICLETTMGFFYRQYAQENVDVLVSLVNNGWFKTSSIAARQLQMLQIRAIETGLPILQSSNMGFTCIVGPKGNIIKSLPQFDQSYLTHNLNLTKIKTLYTTVGDSVVLFSCLLILLNYIILKIKRISIS